MLALIAGAVLLQDAPIAVGTSWNADETVRYHSEEKGIEQTHRFKLTYRVVGQKDHLWTVEKGTRLIETIIDGTSIPPMKADDGPALSKVYLAPRGFLMLVDPWDRAQFGLERLLHFWLPKESLGREWSVNLETNNDQSTGTAKAMFKPQSSHGSISAYRMAYNEESGFKATGKMTFSNETGLLIRAELEAYNAPLPGGLEKANVTILWTAAKG